MISEVKKHKIIRYLKDYKENKSISSACDACDLIWEYLEEGTLKFE